MIRSLDHLVLTVQDLDASERFYVELLGMEAVRFGEGRRALRFGAQKINLHRAGASVAPHAKQPVPGSADLCLLVAGGEAGWAALRTRLDAAGVRWELGPVARTGASGPLQSLYLRDPDGNLLELSYELELPLPAALELPHELAGGGALRLAGPDDAAGCQAIYAPIVASSHTSFETEVPSADEFATRIRACVAPHSWLVIEQDGAIVAYAYSCPHRERAAYRIACEASVYVAESARRQGLARVLYEQLLARARAAGLLRVYAIITLPNPGSIAFHEALGFRPLAHFPEAGRKFDRLWDVGWWGRALA